MVPNGNKAKCLSLVNHTTKTIHHQFIINLQMWTIYESHLIYGSWDMECKGQNLLSFLTVLFALLPPLTTWKIKILKKWKKHLEIYHFTHVYHKWQSHDLWLLRYGAWQTEFFVILAHCLHFYPPNNPKNQNFEKWKNHLDILSLYTCVP